jgi:hypothetical protein
VPAVASHAYCFDFVEICAMTDFDTFERRLATALRSDADLSVLSFDPASITRAAVAGVHRRGARIPRTFPKISIPTRFAVAAAIALVVVGGTLYLIRPTQPSVGGPSQSPALSPTPSPTSTVVQPRPATWTATGNMTTPRSAATAVLLESGKVLVFGGVGINNSCCATSAELYDPVSGLWSATGSMTHEHQTTTLLRDGRVLVTGTGGDTGTDGSAELYNPGSGTWAATGNMTTPRIYHSATLLPDGRVLVAGGQWGVKDRTLNSAELYDPSTGAWKATGRMLVPGGGAATLLRNGKVLVAGGYDPAIGALSAAELYDPASGTWATTGSMVTTIGTYGATLLPDGRVLVVGDGRDGPSLEIYDPQSGSWSPPPAGTWTHDGNDDLIVLLDGRLLLLGVPGSPATETYDFRSGSWVETAGMGRPTAGYTATLLPDGVVLVAGGGWGGVASDPAGPAASGPTIVASAELYDPGTDR